MLAEPTIITTNSLQRSSMAHAISLMTALSNEMHDLSIWNEDRKNLAARCHFTSMEHHAGIALLFSVGHPAPALALLRPVFEAYIRGIWLSDCSSDVELSDFQSVNWKKTPSINAMVSEIEKISTFDSGILGKSLLSNWVTLCGFTHTGIEQLRMCRSDDAIERSCSNEHIDEALGFAGACAIMAGIAIASLANRNDISEHILALGKEFVSR